MSSRSHSLWQGLLSATVCCGSFLLSLPAWAESGLSIKGNPVQGNPLFVQVETSPGRKVDITFLKLKVGPLTADTNGKLRVVIPIGVDTPPGRQEIQVRLAEVADEKLEAEVLSKKIVVSSRHFPTQYLTISASTLASYDNPRNRADDKAILDAMKPFDSVQRWKSAFEAPLQARESTGFGQKRLYNGWKKGWHKGLDLAGWEGQPVMSPAAGKVIHTARGLVNGNTVVISHGLGVNTVYFHLNSIDVEEGSSIKAGQQLGTVGGTGGFAPHLHWEARLWGVPVDPKSFYNLPSGWD